MQTSGFSLIFGALRVATLGLLFATVFELTARVEDYVRWGTPFHSRYRSQSDLVVRDADGVHGRPNSRFRKWRMNNLGTRGPDVSLEKPASMYRIVAAGASETYGLYESPEHEFPRRLEVHLNEALGARTCSSRIQGFEVLNAAMPGMSLPTVRQDIRNRLKKWSPDMVLYYPSPTQYLETEMPVAASPDSSGVPVDPPFTRILHFRTRDRVREQLKALLPEPAIDMARRAFVARTIKDRPADWRFNDPPPERLAAFDAELRGLVTDVRSIGATPMLAAHANLFTPGKPRDMVMQRAWERFYPRATGSTIVAFDSIARITTMNVARDSAILGLDIQPSLDSVSVPTFADFAHFTDAGSNAAALAIARTILAGLEQSGTVCR